MGKKRARKEEAAAATAAATTPTAAKKSTAEAESSDDEDFDIVDVEFEWFNFDKGIDFHGVKSLIRQLLDVDHGLFDISALADLVIGQDTIGSAVKVDGKPTDAYAFLTVLGTPAHAENAAMAQLVDYLVERAGSNPTALGPVVEHLGRADGAAGAAGAGTSRVGIVLSDRLINMPSEISPPMYSMLLEEVEAAVEDGEPYQFTHWLLLSKTYTEVASALDADPVEKPRRKKARARARAGGGQPGAEALATFYFHPEDEVLARHAIAYGGFSYIKEAEATSDAKRAFQEMGIRTQGHMVLIEAAKFPAAVQAICDYLPAPSTGREQAL